MMLKTLRRRAGLTQKQLADKVGVGRSTVAMWENGSVDCGLEMARVLAQILHVSLDDLLNGTSSLMTVDKSHDKPILRVPVLGTIPAGVPLEAIEDILDWEEVPADWARGGAEYFALEIHGNSMNPAYLDGDVVIFRKQPDCESGQDCAVMINGDDATFKRVRLTERGMTLQALNPEYESLFFTNAEVRDLPVRILGKAVELRRKFER